MIYVYFLCEWYEIVFVEGIVMEIMYLGVGVIVVIGVEVVLEIVVVFLELELYFLGVFNFGEVFGECVRFLVKCSILCGKIVDEILC